MTETQSENLTDEIVIDLNEKENVEPDKEKPKTTVKVIPAKRIDELTDEEKKIIIENARAGIDNPYYNVKLYKNGTTRICKSKKPTISQQAVSNKGERLINSNTSDSRKVYMTDNQLIWEHVLELENKYNNLYRKHKKLKAKYNDLYIEDEDIAQKPQPEPQKTPLGLSSKSEQPEHEQPQPEPEPQPEPVYQNYNRRGNWRSMLLNH